MFNARKILLLLRLRKPYFLLIFALFFLPVFSIGNNIDLSGNADFSIKYKKLYASGKEEKLIGNYDEAIELFNKAYFLASKYNREKDKLSSLLELGILYWNIGDLKISSEKYSVALSIAHKLRIDKIQGFCRTALEIYDQYLRAKDYRSANDYEKSVESFKTAIDLAKKIASREHELKCLRQLSINFWELDDFQQFYSLNTQALSIANDINHRQEQGRCLNNIGLYYWKLDNYSEALNFYSRAYNLAKIINNLENQAECLTNMSIIYFDLGNYEKALEHLEEAINIEKKLNNETKLAKDLNNLGETYRRKGLLNENADDLMLALKYFEDSLKLARKFDDTSLEIKVLNNLGAVYSHLSNHSKALENFKFGLKKSEEIHNSEALGMLLNNIGIVYSQLGNYEESTKYYQKAIDLALRIRGGKILWEAYLEIANAYKNQENYKDALANYKKSISVIENIRSGIDLEEQKATYLGTETRIESYYNIIDLLIRLYQRDHEKRYKAEAFHYLEKAKARSFLDSIEVSKVNLSEGINQKLLNQETEIMNQISLLHTKLLTPQLSPEQRDGVNKELENYEDQLESVKRGIRTTSPAYANLRYPRAITFEEAQSELVDKETVFFAYILAKENSYAFVISKKGLTTFPLPGKKEIQKLVRDYLSAITDVDNQDFHLGHKLFELLVRPGLDHAEIQKIVFVPDDILYFLPFETLLTKEKGREWLVKEYNIAYAPSLSSLRELIDRKKQNGHKTYKDLLAVGDPFFGENEVEIEGNNGNEISQSSVHNSKFARLKYSGLETRKIASLFKLDKRDVFLRKQASEDNFKRQNLSDYKIIHLAAHGLIDDKKPARSAIVLSLDQDPNEDGFLQMREVFHLKLNADLVTLSACETGLGQLIKGEGIEGISRAFFYAGASSVLLSLWAINDQASYQLLERFYLHLRSSDSLMNALRKAKLELINSEVLSHPYYWAGFIITGKTDTPVFGRKMNKWIVVTLSLCAGFAILILVMSREKNYLSAFRL